ncbi:hypothetical protein F511_03850 [Dorcoceras hygrometricum]|uniref:E3 ubiquitin-protein ligase RMA n=1 Tax=Dorcoceras hygrometricum TaxID=472368 RepID=A0A2Z7BPM4_9LAMI|nr:hypothetical protein F511_03850 [Dorcoceras hygrometricum]
MGNANATGLTSRDATLIGPNNVMSESRPVEISKNRENRYAFSTNETQDKKADENIHNNESVFFDCNICLDLAKEPVVTCCGHLFCWPCIYRWVDHHSSANECPVCKGKVTVKNIVPIYGRGPNTPESDADSSTKIPPRPQAQRAERSSQLIQRVRGVENSFDFAHFQNYSTTTSITGPTSSSLSAESEFFIGSYSHINHMESIREVALTFEDSGSMSNNGVIHYSDQTLDNSADSFSARSSRRRNGTSRDSDASTVDLPRTRRRLS